MGMESTDHDWWALDIDPKFPTFNSSDLAFDTTAFGLQSLQVSSSSTSSSTDCRFNQDFPPTFNSPNLSFDTPPAFGFEQSSHPSHLDNGPSTDFTSIVPNNNPSFSVPSVVALAVNASAPRPSQFLGATSFMQFQPTQAPAPVFPHAGALPANTLPSNASSPTVVAGNAPHHIPATSNASPQSTTTPAPAPAFPHTGALLANTFPSLSNASSPTVVPGNAQQHIQPAAAPSDTSSPLPTQNTAAIAPPVHTGAKNGTPSPLSDLPHSQSAGNPETSALSSVSGTMSSISLNQVDSRRSGRNPVPSKRHDQMNEIDGKGNNKTASAHIETENIPPSTIPEWTIASHDHLLNSDLGKDWTACVRAWFELEQELGYGSQAGAKVCLLVFFSSSWTSDLNLCDRERYHSQQLVHRSGQVGHLSPVVVSATTRVRLQLLMPPSLELPYRVGGIASSPPFASLILGLLPPSTPVQWATRMPGLRCEKAAPTVSYHFSPYSFGGARHWRSNLNGRSTAPQTGSIWFWM